MVEVGSIVVSIGFFGVDDSDRDRAMVIESAIMGGSAAGMVIGGEGIGAKAQVLLVVVVEGRVMDIKIERVVNLLRADGGVNIHTCEECSSK